MKQTHKPGKVLNFPNNKEGDFMSVKKVEKEKVLNGEIFNAWGVLQGIVTNQFPVGTTMDLLDLTKSLSDEYQKVETARNGFITKYGDANKEGNVELVGPNDKDGRGMSANWVSFVTDVNELFMMESDITFKKVTLPRKVTVRCEKCKHLIETPLMMSVPDVMALEKFVGIAKE